MKILETTSALRAWRRAQGTRSVGFVPTMGALHDGHGELIRKSVAENGVTLLSIFVNPTQFNNPDDLKNYPVTWEADLALAQKLGVHAVFSPRSPDEMYPEGYEVKITEDSFSKLLCGAHRPGHFDGVLSVVMKLFQLAQPTRAYFGEKDFQQLTLIRKMVRSYFLDLEIVSVPTMREPSGLAMSSRNLRLTPEEKVLAPKLYETISEIDSVTEARSELESLGFKVDYLEDHQLNGELRRFVAATLGKVRLIDNVRR